MPSPHRPEGDLAESKPRPPARSQAPAPPEVKPERAIRNQPQLIEPTPVTAFGSVLAAEDDAPIIGAHLHWVSSGRRNPLDPANQGSPAAITNALGQFELEGHQVLPSQALVTAEGRSPLLFQPNRWSRDDAGPQVLRMQRAATLRGTVDGIPPGNAEAMVLLQCPSHLLIHATAGFFSRTKPLRWTCPIGTDGRFEASDLPAGVPLAAEVLFDAKTLLRVPGRIAIPGGETHTVEWDAGAAVPVRVRAQDPSGKPVAKADLALCSASSLRSDWIYTGAKSEQEGWTDSQGMLVFANVPPCSRA